MRIFHVTWRRHVDSRVCDKNDVVSGARAFLLLLFVSACKWIPKITVETPWRITASGFWLFYHFPPDMNFLPIISISIVVTLVLLSSGSSSTSLPNDPLLGIAPGGSSSSLSSGVLFVKFVIGQSLLECVGLWGCWVLAFWGCGWMIDENLRDTQTWNITVHRTGSNVRMDRRNLPERSSMTISATAPMARMSQVLFEPSLSNWFAISSLLLVGLTFCIVFGSMRDATEGK